jgi:MFS family permease
MIVKDDRNRTRACDFHGVAAIQIGDNPRFYGCRRWWLCVLGDPVLPKVAAPFAGENAIAAYAMTPTERRASFSLAAIFALRMLGLFLILPVFAIEAARYPGGDDPALIGLAMGLYGLTQALLQFPFGLLSDRLGRKRVIVFGLLVFAAGSFVAAWAPSLTWLAIGRGVQGAGAISAAVTALLADQTRDVVCALSGRSTFAGGLYRTGRAVCPDGWLGPDRCGGGYLVGTARASRTQEYAAWSPAGGPAVARFVAA